MIFLFPYLYFMFTRMLLTCTNNHPLCLPRRSLFKLIFYPLHFRLNRCTRTCCLSITYHNVKEFVEVFCCLYCYFSCSPPPPFCKRMLYATCMYLFTLDFGGSLRLGQCNEKKHSDANYRMHDNIFSWVRRWCDEASLVVG